MTRNDYEAILNRNSQIETGKPRPSSWRLKVSSLPPAAREETYWKSRPRKGVSPPNARRRSLLKTYLEIGGQRFLATGIQVEGKFVHPDKGAMKQLLRYGIVALVDGRFGLTNAGRRFIAQPPGSDWTEPPLGDAPQIRPEKVTRSRPAKTRSKPLSSASSAKRKPWHGRIDLDPKVMLGKPVIHGTRITVESILRKLGAGLSFDDIRDDHPRLRASDIRAAQSFAADFIAADEVAYG